MLHPQIEEYRNYFRHTRHNYYGLRHGESRAQILDLIVSDLANNRREFGISTTGVQQIQHAAFEANRRITRPLYIFYSPFIRTAQSAHVFRKTIQRPVFEYHQDERLVERHFGDLEGVMHANRWYGRVWHEDITLPPTKRNHGVELAADVALRMIDIIYTCETVYATRIPCDVVLVSHGDPLRMLQQALAGEPATHGHNMRWRNGEFRPLLFFSPEAAKP